MIAVLLLLTMKLLPGTVGNVTFGNTHYCALKGSSVEFSCSFSRPAGEVLEETKWYKRYFEQDKWARVALSVLPSYDNRTEYLGDQLSNCKLAIHNLQDDDTGLYFFRFDTDKFGRYSKQAVELSVTELKAAVHPQKVKAGHTVTLDCQTSCTHPNIVWYKDGQRLTKPESFQAQAEDAGKYVCAVGEQESEPVTLNVQYSPFNVCVEVSPPGVLAVGTSVNLTCSSVANPAAEHYTWFRLSSDANSLLQVGSEQVLSLPSVGASHAGRYLCQAGNAVSHSKSMPVLLTVEETDHTPVIIILIIMKVVMVVLLTLVFIWIWRQRCSCTEDTRGEESNDYENEREVNS